MSNSSDENENIEENLIKDEHKEQIIENEETDIEKNNISIGNKSSSDSENNNNDGTSESNDSKGEVSSSSGSELDNIMIVIDPDIKKCTLLSCFFCMATITFSLCISIIQKRISTFDFTSVGLKMNIYMMFVYLVLLDLSNLWLFILILKEKEQMLIKIIYSNLRWFFVLTQFCFGCLFLIGIIWEASNWTWILSASVNMATTILLAFFFQDIKQKKNMELGSFICIYCYLSILFAFISYATFYNFSCILIENNLGKSNEIRKGDYTSVIQIVTNFFQTILGIVLLTYYKDFFFSLGSFYILLALVVNKDFSLYGDYTYIIVFLLLLFCSTIIILLKNGKKTFGYEEVKDIDVPQADHPKIKSDNLE